MDDYSNDPWIPITDPIDVALLGKLEERLSKRSSETRRAEKHLHITCRSLKMETYYDSM